jgi:hypothetical protein
MSEDPHDAALNVLSGEDGGRHEGDRLSTSADDRRDPDRPQSAPRGLLVEFVRLIMVSLFALAGWQIANSTGPDRPTGILLGILMGSGVGYVLGGVFGRRTASEVSEFEREFRRIPAPELLAGGIGLLLGMILATLLSVPVRSINASPTPFAPRCYRGSECPSPGSARAGDRPGRRIPGGRDDGSSWRKPSICWATRSASP